MTPSNDLPALPDTTAPTDTLHLNPEDRRAQAASAMRRCWTMTGGLIAASALALAACVPSAPVPPSPPAPTPAPTAMPTPAPAPSADWQGMPLSPGDWRYVAGGTTTRALFGADNAGARFVVACDRTQRQVSLRRAADLTKPALMTITTTETARTLATTLSAAANPREIVATLPPHDATLDAIVFTRGRFMVQVPGAATLYLPSWPEIARVVEDCR